MSEKELIPEIPSQLTPMMQQYMAVKNQHPSHLLFYRMGDFFELFFEDAIKASQILEIVLTKRGVLDGSDVPMCGVPVHSYELYLHKLIKQNFSIAICDQVETPEEAKKLRGYKAVVKREVTRIITPATLLEENLLNANLHNYLACINLYKNNYSLAYLDISTEDFYFASFSDVEKLINHLSNINPKELILPDDLLKNERLKNHLKNTEIKLANFHSSFFEGAKCQKKIESFYQIKSLDGLGDLSVAEIGAIGAIINYVEITQINNLPKLSFPKKFLSEEFLQIDAISQNSLELMQTSRGEYKNSLIHIINHTVTASGSRLMKEFLNFPLTNITKIEKRLEVVDFFAKKTDLMESLRGLLKNISDIERILSRINTKRAYSNDLLGLKLSLAQILPISEKLYFLQMPPLLKEIVGGIGNHDDTLNLLTRAIDENAPLRITNGGVIKQGFDARLDEYRNLEQGAEKIKEELIEKYRKITGISNLKIKENNVIGIFIEVTAQNFEKISSNPEFIHRQTLANQVRFTSKELRELENKIINSRQYSLKLEQEIFNEIIEKISAKNESLRQTARSFALLDVVLNLAYIALKYNLLKPILDESEEIIIEEGRHLIVEQGLKKTGSQDFIPNDLRQNNQENIYLITGPNMAGKSTYLRQNALIIILAQIGSFVPAKIAKIGIVDRLFTRIGASDDLSSNKSTFMVEMIETANILNNATKKSFIILDEIGRGTSTQDGLSLAYAILEHLYSRVNARCLFATHYHELATMAKNFKNLGFYTVQIKEWNKEIIFMHKIIKGVAEKSYGIHVAKIAGLPRQVIARAENILLELEKNHSQDAKIDLLNFTPQKPKVDYSFLAEELTRLDVDNLSPKDALSLLYKMKGELP
ncbi:MAG: DNA mismatch repair protein MutS, partial [Alphaproteobacteria bacterium]